MCFTIWICLKIKDVNFGNYDIPDGAVMHEEEEHHDEDEHEDEHHEDEHHEEGYGVCK